MIKSGHCVLSFSESTTDKKQARKCMEKAVLKVIKFPTKIGRSM
jgi:hypothetical protein